MNLDDLERLLSEATASQPNAGLYMLASHKEVEFLSALRNSAEELIRDARRYRWLRDPNNDTEGTVPYVAGDDLDAAIDAAIAQEGKG